MRFISTFKKPFGLGEKLQDNSEPQTLMLLLLGISSFPGKQVTEQEFHPLPMFYLGGLCISLGWLRCIGAVAVE